MPTEASEAARKADEFMDTLGIEGHRLPDGHPTLAVAFSHLSHLRRLGRQFPDDEALSNARARILASFTPPTKKPNTKK